MNPPAAHAAVPSRRRRRVPAYAGLLIAALVFLAMAPTLRWLQLSNGIEQLHVATVLEMRRDGGSWLMPTLNDVLRIKKPPLPAWIGALIVSDATVAGASAADRATRDAAFVQLAWEIRWPALLAGCLMLVATFDLARTLAGARAALAATIITGTCLLFFRYMRLASTDVHLALWVTVTNAMLARAALRRQRWCIVAAGFAVALAFMCKGPVGLLQTIVPLAAWWFIARRNHVRSTSPPAASAKRSLLVPVLLAIVAFLAVALPWPIMVWMSNERALQTWWQEITREGATDHEYGPIWAYLSLLPHLLPWLPAFVLGFALTLRRTSRPSARHPLLRHHGYLLALLWLVVPIVVMSLFRDKSERYLLPMLPVAGILAARGLLATFAGVRRGRKDAGAWLSSHFVIIVAIAIFLPALGAIPPSALPDRLDLIRFSRVGEDPWYTPALAIGTIATGIVAWFVVMWLQNRRKQCGLAVGVAAALMLAINAVFLWGYRTAPASQSEMRPIAEHILARAPNAKVAYYEPGGKAMPPDLATFLNRVVRPLPVIRRRGESEPQIIVTMQRQNEPLPALEGWRSFVSVPYGDRIWHAMEPINPPPATKPLE